MTRSDKEIREKLKERYIWKSTQLKGIPKWMKDNEENLTKLTSACYKTFTADALNWALEGEPRFSVVELEKILTSPQWIKYRYSTDFSRKKPIILCQFLKDKKKTEAILNG